jgi:outer membrane protein assembly factor BamD (BamD/ComL family)
MSRAPRWLALLALCVPSIAAADVASTLRALETEAAQLGQNLPTPHANPPTTSARRLVDAQVAFAIGDYDTAALALFDLAAKPGPDQETAAYYLAESLYQNKDRSGARTYFSQVVASNNTASKYYQPSLVRLIEIAIAQQELEDAKPYVEALDRLSPSQRLPSVPYVRGKLAFADGKYDDALAYFQDVPKGSEYELQALYYTGTTHVAKKQLPQAQKVFAELVERKPRTARDRRVIELSQLALGRIHYEMDQPSKSIDSYLLVDRHSDLFPDALYEVAWVYVKGKQYDKALRALELLALSEPQSTKTPTVRLLEGNLRIRKAQLLRDAIINNLADEDTPDPEVEYEKAAKVFEETHAAYFPSYQALSQMVDGQMNPEQFLAQIAGRSTHVFQAAMPIPEAAAQALREDPRVSRAISVATDLGSIEASIAESEATIARLSAVIDAGDPDAIYPALSARRSRIGELQDQLIALRADLAEQQLKRISASGQVSQLAERRRSLLQSYTSSPSPEQTRADVVEAARGEVDQLEEQVDEVAQAIDQTQAMAVALRVYAGSKDDSGEPRVSPEIASQIDSELQASVAEAAAIEDELASLRRELTLRRDLAGVGDTRVTEARARRRELVAALDAEHRALASAVAGNRDAQSASSLAERAMRVSEQLAATERQIDERITAGIAQARTLLAQERQYLDTYKAELAAVEAEAKNIGGTALGASFRRVKSQFYDIVVRSDVGAIDVRWSQKENADDELKRLNLSRTRELKQLRDEFKTILDTVTPNTPATPAAAPVMPAASGSPDQGTSSERVSPGSGQPATPPAPVVRPDNETQPAAQGGTR